MPDIPQLRTALVRLIATVTDVPEDAIAVDSRFDELGDWSSHVALRLFTALEDTFGVRLNLKTYLETETVGALAELTMAAAAIRSR